MPHLKHKKKIFWLSFVAIIVVGLVAGVLIWGLNGGFAGLESQDERADERTAQTEADDAEKTEEVAPVETGPATPVLEYQQKAEAQLAEMSLAEKVGQMFIARCPEANAADGGLRRLHADARYLLDSQLPVLLPDPRCRHGRDLCALGNRQDHRARHAESVGA